MNKRFNQYLSVAVGDFKASLTSDKISAQIKNKSQVNNFKQVDIKSFNCNRLINRKIEFIALLNTQKYSRRFSKNSFIFIIHSFNHNVCFINKLLSINIFNDFKSFLYLNLPQIWLNFPWSCCAEICCCLPQPNVVNAIDNWNCVTFSIEQNIIRNKLYVIYSRFFYPNRSCEFIHQLSL